MPGEFSYTFRQHSIVLTRDEPNSNWYIRVRAPNGCYAYDGWWRDSAGRPLKDALYQAKVGAGLIPPSPPMTPSAGRTP